jgi:pimeloyl-ACP methyl ester carboxylesterase
MTAGCSTLAPPSVPLRTVDLAVSGADGGGRCLAVLLPGRHDEPERFAKAGFARAVASRGLPVDLVAVDAHLGYFRTRTVVERLRTDVIAPAQAAGYETIWIVGTSLGGLGGLLYLREHPEDLDGVLALAPYLGEPRLLQEIDRAGGPTRWIPQATTREGDPGRELWSWLGPWAIGSPAVPLHLGWGIADDFDASNRMLAGLLPHDRVYTAVGGHDWRTWEELWESFLDRTSLCAPRPQP